MAGIFEKLFQNIFGEKKNNSNSTLNLTFLTPGTSYASIAKFRESMSSRKENISMQGHKLKKSKQFPTKSKNMLKVSSEIDDNYYKNSNDIARSTEESNTSMLNFINNYKKIQASESVKTKYSEVNVRDKNKHNSDQPLLKSKFVHKKKCIGERELPLQANLKDQQYGRGDQHILKLKNKAKTNNNRAPKKSKLIEKNNSNRNQSKNVNNKTVKNKLEDERKINNILSKWMDRKKAVDERKPKRNATRLNQNVKPPKNKRNKSITCDDLKSKLIVERENKRKESLTRCDLRSKLIDEPLRENKRYNSPAPDDIGTTTMDRLSKENIRNKSPTRGDLKTKWINIPSREDERNQSTTRCDRRRRRKNRTPREDIKNNSTTRDDLRSNYWIDGPLRAEEKNRSITRCDLKSRWMDKTPREDRKYNFRDDLRTTRMNRLSREDVRNISVPRSDLKSRWMDRTSKEKLKIKSYTRNDQRTTCTDSPSREDKTMKSHTQGDIRTRKMDRLSREDKKNKSPTRCDFRTKWVDRPSRKYKIRDYNTRYDPETKCMDRPESEKNRNDFNIRSDLKNKKIHRPVTENIRSKCMDKLSIENKSKMWDRPLGENKRNDKQSSRSTRCEVKTRWTDRRSRKGNRTPLIRTKIKFKSTDPSDMGPNVRHKSKVTIDDNSMETMVNRVSLTPIKSASITDNRVPSKKCLQILPNKIKRKPSSKKSPTKLNSNTDMQVVEDEKPLKNKEVKDFTQDAMYTQILQCWSSILDRRGINKPKEGKVSKSICKNKHKKKCQMCGKNLKNKLKALPSCEEMQPNKKEDNYVLDLKLPNCKKEIKASNENSDDDRLQCWSSLQQRRQYLIDKKIKTSDVIIKKNKRKKKGKNHEKSNKKQKLLKDSCLLDLNRTEIQVKQNEKGESQLTVLYHASDYSQSTNTLVSSTYQFDYPENNYSKSTINGKSKTESEEKMREKISYNKIKLEKSKNTMNNSKSCSSSGNSDDDTFRNKKISRKSQMNSMFDNQLSNKTGSNTQKNIRDIQSSKNMNKKNSSNEQCLVVKSSKKTKLNRKNASTDSYLNCTNLEKKNSPKIKSIVSRNVRSVSSPTISTRESYIRPNMNKSSSNDRILTTSKKNSKQITTSKPSLRKSKFSVKKCANMDLSSLHYSQSDYSSSKSKSIFREKSSSYQSKKSKSTAKKNPSKKSFVKSNSLMKKPSNYEVLIKSLIPAFAKQSQMLKSRNVKSRSPNKSPIVDRVSRKSERLNNPLKNSKSIMKKNSSEQYSILSKSVHQSSTNSILSHGALLVSDKMSDKMSTNSLRSSSKSNKNIASYTRSKSRLDNRPSDKLILDIFSQATAITVSKVKFSSDLIEKKDYSLQN